MYIVVLIETNLLANFVLQNSNVLTTAAIMFRNVLPERFSVFSLFLSYLSECAVLISTNYAPAYSTAERGGCFQRRLFVNTITSERLNVG